MQLYSTANHRTRVSFTEAIQDAFPIDRGLYFPSQIPRCDALFIKEMHNQSMAEIATQLAQLWLSDEIPMDSLEKICHEAFNFPVKEVSVSENRYILELFHGPTLAFKDFGARFMAKTLNWISQNNGNSSAQYSKIRILTATSGDTGGAVANAFQGIPDMEVLILFPLDKLSLLQRRQLTTYGYNIKAIGIKGNFDDCQRLVKEALIDKDIKARTKFCSANSINIGRLIPQSFYYFYGYSRLKQLDLPLVYSVPSGNFGNLTAGIMAKRMGLDIEHFIAATNQNDSIPRFLKTGEFKVSKTFETFATAMDVGNPSNFNRLLELFANNTGNFITDLNFEQENMEQNFDQESMEQNIPDSAMSRKMNQLITGIKVEDGEILKTIKEWHDTSEHCLDPHTAVGLQALKVYEKICKKPFLGIVLGTAHPAKFPALFDQELGIKIPIPIALLDLLESEERFKTMDTDFKELKNYLLEEVL